MRKWMRLVLATALALTTIPLVLVVTSPARALENGLSRTPALGWNTWNAFGCDVSEQLIRQSADVMVSSGMAAAGYQYVNIDDCWMTHSRDAAGNLVPDPVKFPGGMAALASYVHGKGLKLGIYEDAGSQTCAGYPGSLGHEVQDAKLFASWTIDYLKYDNCNSDGTSAKTRYTTMRDALAATGRQIVFSLCNWGEESVWTWGAPIGNSWRNTYDIAANWRSVMSILDLQVGKENYSGPGAWNDPDMLEVGNPGLSDVESQAHFSLWAVLNAPLIAGNDLRSMSAKTREILTNGDVLGVNQDWGGKQGYKIVDDGDRETWLKPMANGSRAVVLLNRGSGASSMSVSATQLGLPSATSYAVRDLWAHTDSAVSATVSATVPAHGAAMFTVAANGGSPSPSVSPSRSASPSASASQSASPSLSPSRSATPSASVTPTATPVPTSFTLVAEQLRRCAEVPVGPQLNGALVRLGDCVGQPNQRWTLTSSRELRSALGKCLSAVGSTAQIRDCGGGQQWIFGANGSISDVRSGRCLDAGAGTAQTPIALRRCTGLPSQRWIRT
jgi:alpha-galactosidase